MKEVTIDGIIYVPKGQEGKILNTYVAQLPILSTVERMKWDTYKSVLKICAYLNNEFKSDGNQWVITHELRVDDDYSTLEKVFHFTSKEAAKYALLHFKEVFKTFYS